MNKKKVITLLSAGLMVLTLGACGQSINSDPTPDELVADGVLSGISLSGDYKREFEQDSVFNTEGLVVKGIYTDASMKVVTGYQVSSPDMSTLGNKTVTVTYTEAGKTVSKSYTITVIAKYVPPAPEEIPENKTINLGNQEWSTTKEVSYTLLEEEKPHLIEYLRVRIHVDMNGNDTSHDYWGGYFIANGARLDISSSFGASKDVDGPDSKHKTSADYVFTYEVSEKAKLAAGNVISIKQSYFAAGLTFKAVSFELVYGSFAPRCVEKLTPENTYIKQDGVNKTVTVDTTTLKNKGKLKKIVINTSFSNNETYGSGTLYFEGINVNPIRSSSVMNIGGYIPKKASSEAEAATGISDIEVYPVTETDLKSGTPITFTTWYMSATSAKVNSISFVTETENAPTEVTNLESVGVDGGVALSWTAPSGATSYDIYVNGSCVANASKDYYTVTGLTNGETYTFGVVAKNALGSSSMATIEGTPEKGADYDQFIDGINTTLEQTIGSAGLKKMFTAANFEGEQSNNRKFKEVIEGMQLGLDTTIAYIGGSITVGENAELKDGNNHQKGYAYYSFDWLKNTYATIPDNTHFVNASISGTDSTIALTRIQEDVIDRQPDLIFIEFAANNSNNEVDNCTYESLVRKCLTLPNAPAVVLVFSATSYTGSTEATMKTIGNHYGLPMMSMHQALLSVMSKSDMTKDKTASGSDIWKGFINDGTHPNDIGHKLFGKVLASYLKGMVKDTKDNEFTLPNSPKTPNFDRFTNIVNVNNRLNDSIVTSLGSFIEADTSTHCTSKQSDTIGLQHGWLKKADAGNTEMVINVTAKNFILTYECGNAGVTADNNPKGSIVVTYKNVNNPSDTDSYTWNLNKSYKQSSFSNLHPDLNGGSTGWQNPASLIIFDKATAGDYEIKIKTSNNTDICVIMALAYTA